MPLLYVEIDVRSYGTMVERLNRSNVVPELRVWMFHVSLMQLPEGLELLLRNIYRLVQYYPRRGLMTGRHSGGTFVRHVMLRVR